MKIKYTFNMIEVVLALLVISIGIMSIMGLVPIGMKNHYNAIHQNQTADSAEEFLHTIAYNCTQNTTIWDATVGTFDVPTRTWNQNGGFAWSKDTLNLGDTAAVPILIAPWTLQEDLDGIRYYTIASGRIYRLVRTHKRIVDGNETEVNEIDAVFGLWLSPVSGVYREAGAIKESTLDRVVRLNVEVSWPGSVEYAKRSKSYYVVEVQKP